MNEENMETSTDKGSRIGLNKKINYIGVFLTFGCNYNCSYCINRHSGRLQSRKQMSAEMWIEAMNRLETRRDLPISLQGGEPTTHPEFYEIVNGIDKSRPIDLLTNMQFEVKEFQSHIKPERLRRNAPYASIRVSFHPEVMDLDETIEKALAMQNAGYSIGLFGVLHPDQKEIILAAQKRCVDLGLDFRTKEFLGQYQDKLHGTYRYPKAVDGLLDREVQCRTTELLIDPAGFIYRCHRDVYAGWGAIGHVLDGGLPEIGILRPCSALGTCNPCDIKLKTNRFQEFGHCSVEIIDGQKELSDQNEERLPDKSAMPVAAE